MTPHPLTALQDAQRAIGLVRAHAAEWQVDPHKVGVLDFSAKSAGVPVEMHLYANGGHAFGLRRTRDPITEWPQLVERWLGTIGVIDTGGGAHTTSTHSSSAASGLDTTRVRELPGCYRLALGPWTNPSELRPPAPAQAFRLDSATVRDGTARAGTAARVVPVELMPPTDPRAKWLRLAG